MRKNFFNVLVCSVLSASVMLEMDFSDLSALDWAVIGATGAMWVVCGIYFWRGDKNARRQA